MFSTSEGITTKPPPWTTHKTHQHHPTLSEPPKYIATSCSTQYVTYSSYKGYSMQKPLPLKVRRGGVNISPITLLRAHYLNEVYFRIYG
jgi:hypothetical protein